MTDLNALSPREAVTDALRRAILGLDSNSPSLLASACLTTPDMQFIGNGYCVTGWDAVNVLFQRVFELITTHVATNVRITFEDVSTALLTAHVVSYHVRPEDKESMEEKSYTAYSLYYLGLVKEGETGLWKIKKWEANVLRTTGDKAIIHGKK